VTSAREKEPDLALLDVDMPKMDGIKAARLIGALSPRTKILMLSAFVPLLAFSSSTGKL
jgi:YesN/AraC family two-component response regulator